MRRYVTASPVILGALSLLPGAMVGVGAQDLQGSVTLEEAESLFGQNSLELRLARSRLRESFGAVRQGRAIPNPRLTMSHEALGDYSESYLNLSQQVDFIWESADRAARAEASRARAGARFTADSARLVLQMKSAFLDAWARRETLAGVQLAADVVEELLASAEARFLEGDLAGYDLRRLRLERIQSLRRAGSAELELEAAERRLGFILGESGKPTRFTAESLNGFQERLPAREELLALALRNRPELLGAQSLVTALGAEAGLTRSSVLRGTGITGGLKRQADGMEGLFVGLEVPIPLADRRGGARDAARAAVVRAESEVDLLRRIVTRDVALARSRLRTAQEQQALFGSASLPEARELLEIARLSFAEGEMRVVDLLDAAETLVETSLLNSQIQTDLWSAFFELEWAIGGFSTGPNSGGNER